MDGGRRRPQRQPRRLDDRKAERTRHRLLRPAGDAAQRRPPGRERQARTVDARRRRGRQTVPAGGGDEDRRVGPTCRLCAVARRHRLVLFHRSGSRRHNRRSCGTGELTPADRPGRGLDGGGNPTAPGGRVDARLARHDHPPRRNRRRRRRRDRGGDRRAADRTTMTQYPNPYSPPAVGYAQQTYWDPTRDLLAPARRASTFMFVYGGIMMLCGGCSLANAAMQSPETIRKVQEMFPNLEMPSPRQTAITAGALLGASILFVALGAWVRGGRRGAAITSIVFVALILLWQALGFVVGLLTGVPPAAMGVQLCISTFLVIIPLIVLLVFLVQVVRNSGQIDG